MVALNMPTQTASNPPTRPRLAWFMTIGFFIYTLFVLIGHIVGFPLAYAYLHTVCANGCSLTPGNVRALEHISISIAFYTNLYMVIQAIYILVCIGIAVLIVFKKPGQWVPLGMSGFLVGLSAYEGADYPALASAYPVLNAPTQLLIGLGMGVLGMYALLTFPNGKFGSPWVLGYYLVNIFEGVLAVFITNPVFVLINTVFSLLSFPLIVGILIYRSRRVMNAKERAATKWIILSFSIFILSILLVFILLPAVAPADSLVLLIANIAGFFGCGVNIAGFLMAVLYANAFDIDVFVRRTLVYGLLTAILLLTYLLLVFTGEHLLVSLLGQTNAVVLVSSTLIVAALFQPLRQRIQRIVDRRFYRSKYDAAKIIAAYSATLRQEVDLERLQEDLLAVVQETMQPAHVSLWLRTSEKETRSSREEREVHT
jgi:hypothetical protein